MVEMKKAENVTGVTSENEFMHLIYNFEKYSILVKLTLDGRFVGIDEVTINEDFRSLKERKTRGIYEDLDELPSE